MLSIRSNNGSRGKRDNNMWRSFSLVWVAGSQCTRNPFISVPFGVVASRARYEIESKMNTDNRNIKVALDALWSHPSVIAFRSHFAGFRSILSDCRVSTVHTAQFRRCEMHHQGVESLPFVCQKAAQQAETAFTWSTRERKANFSSFNSGRGNFLTSFPPVLLRRSSSASLFQLLTYTRAHTNT